MRFINTTEQSMSFKIMDEWTTVAPGIIVDLPDLIGLKQKGLIEVKTVEEIVKETPIVKKKKVSKKKTSKK